MASRLRGDHTLGSTGSVLGAALEARGLEGSVELVLQGEHVGAARDLDVKLQPVWRGFLLNTVFYALAFILPAGMWWSLRRLIRRRRGLCPGCGYPMGESDVCTECGKALPGFQAQASPHDGRISMLMPHRPRL